MHACMCSNQIALTTTLACTIESYFLITYYEMYLGSSASDEIGGSSIIYFCIANADHMTFHILSMIDALKVYSQVYVIQISQRN